MRATYLVIAVVALSACGKIVRGDESDGLVESVKNNELLIKPDLRFIPKVGDKMEILARIPGVGEATVGSAVITRIGSERIHARVETATGKVQPGQFVRSHSAATREPALPSPPQRFLVVTSATAKVMTGETTVGQVHSGQRIAFSKQNGDWFLIQVELDGKPVRGWIHRRDAIPEIDASSAAVNQTPASVERVSAVPGWGTVVDPQRDCEISATADGLSIRVPGTFHDLAPFEGFKNMDAPRVLQTVRGDFVAKVRVKKSQRPSPGTGVNADQPRSYVSAGLLVWQDELHLLRLQRAANGDTGFVGSFGQFISDGKNIGGSLMPRADDATYQRRVNQDAYLRLERKSGRFVLWESNDGRNWTMLRTQGQDLTLADTVAVGVFVINATNRPIQREFADFSLTTNGTRQ